MDAPLKNEVQNLATCLRNQSLVKSPVVLHLKNITVFQAHPLHNWCRQRRLAARLLNWFLQSLQARVLRNRHYQSGQAPLPVRRNHQDSQARLRPNKPCRENQVYPLAFGNNRSIQAPLLPLTKHRRNPAPSHRLLKQLPVKSLAARHLRLKRAKTQAACLLDSFSVTAQVSIRVQGLVPRLAFKRVLRQVH